MKQIKFGTEAREEILSGITESAQAIGATYGRKGRYSILYGANSTWKATKDGVSVAKEIYFRSHPKNVGAQMVRQAADSTVKLAGDGTTATSILTASLCEKVFEYIKNGSNPVVLKNEMSDAVKEVIGKLKDMAVAIKDGENINYELLNKVCHIAANSDSEISSVVAQAMKQVGADGIFDVQMSSNNETTIEKAEGTIVDSGWINPYFVKDRNKMKTTLENPYILIYDRKITEFKHLVGVIEQTIAKQKPLLIICDDLADEALATTVANFMKGALNVCVIKCPSYGANRRYILEDIACITGGEFVSEERQIKLNKVSLEHLGQADKVVIEKSKTTIIGGKGEEEKIKTYFANLKSQIESEENEEEKAKLKDRYSKLKGGVAVIKVGGFTPQEIEEKIDRVDDAICASRSAIEEGILAGGATSFLKLANQLTSESDGCQIVKFALQAPFLKLLENAGVDDLRDEDFIRHKSLSMQVAEAEKNIGYNLETDKMENLIESGVIDSAKVVRCSLENAMSIAEIFTLTESVIVPQQ